MELLIDFEAIQDSSKKELLLSTLKLLEIKFKFLTRPETLVEFNFEFDPSQYLK